MPGGEDYALICSRSAGMMLMAAATDLLVIFLALEMLSLGVYVLTGIRREAPAGAEAAFKYFLLGAFSSAFFLYGIAFAYTIAGSTRLDQIGTRDRRRRRTPRWPCSPSACCGRVRVQGLGRAVPHVDARRLRRRADDCHRVHVDRREGGGVRSVRARFPLDAAAAAGTVGARVVGDRRRRR